jgi:tryptophan synthase beta chain
MDLFADRNGHYGRFGGAYTPEILRCCLAELSETFYACKDDPSFWPEFEALMAEYSCRETPITHLSNVSAYLGGAQIYAKREDLNHTGAHKLNNAMGQGLMMKRMGKKRVIAETGAGQHGVATATMAAKMGFECKIYMGAEDVARQRPNVFWMESMGAEVVGVESGTKTLKDAINECMRDWNSSMDDTHYCLGTTCGPAPFPEIVSYFQSIVGAESQRQMKARIGRMPDKVYACVGGGSNAMGIFLGFLDESTELVGVEAGGDGLDSGRHASRIASGEAKIGVSGYKTYFLQDQDGQMKDTYSVAAGLDYVGISPIIAHLHDIGRVRIEASSDEEVKQALSLTMKKEGLIPALETSHAFAQAYKEAAGMSKDEVLLISMSGRGDKDIFTVADALADERWDAFLKAKVEQKHAR